MFGVALEIKLEHFKKLLLNPISAFVGVLSQFLVLPFLTFVLAVLKDFITPTIALGMILVAACPGGNMSNFFSSLAKDNVALSVSLTAIATIAAVFMPPLNFSLWGEFIYPFFGSFQRSTAGSPSAYRYDANVSNGFSYFGNSFVSWYFCQYKMA